MRLLYKYEWMYQVVRRVSAVPMWAPAIAVLIAVVIGVPIAIWVPGDDSDPPSVVEPATPVPSPTRESTATPLPTSARPIPF